MLCIYTNLPVSDIVRLPHPLSGDSQGQETLYIFIYIHMYIYVYLYLYTYVYTIYVYKVFRMNKHL